MDEGRASPGNADGNFSGPDRIEHLDKPRRKGVMDKQRFPLALGLASMVLGLATIPATGAAATRAGASAVL